MVARILAGSTIDRQGLLQRGDIILEVNNVSIRDPEHLQYVINVGPDSLTFKIAPSTDVVPATKHHQVNIIFLKNYNRNDIQE